jgi:hypothetical protein
MVKLNINGVQRKASCDVTVATTPFHLKLELRRHQLYILLEPFKIFDIIVYHLNAAVLFNWNMTFVNETSCGFGSLFVQDASSFDNRTSRLLLGLVLEITKQSLPVGGKIESNF